MSTTLVYFYRELHYTAVACDVKRFVGQSHFGGILGPCPHLKTAVKPSSNRIILVIYDERVNSTEVGSVLNVLRPSFLFSVFIRSVLEGSKFVLSIRAKLGSRNCT